MKPSAVKGSATNANSSSDPSLQSALNTVCHEVEEKVAAKTFDLETALGAIERLHTLFTFALCSKEWTKTIAAPSNDSRITRLFSSMYKKIQDRSTASGSRVSISSIEAIRAMKSASDAFNHIAFAHASMASDTKSGHEKLATLYHGPNPVPALMPPFTFPPNEEIFTFLAPHRLQGCQRLLESVTILCKARCLENIITPRAEGAQPTTALWCPISVEALTAANSLYAALTGPVLATSSLSAVESRRPGITQAAYSPKAWAESAASSWRTLIGEIQRKFFVPLSLTYNLAESWTDCISRGTFLYLYFVLLISARSASLLEAAGSLRPYLRGVADLIYERSQPITHGAATAANSRRFSWNKVPNSTLDQNEECKTLGGESAPAVEGDETADSSENRTRSFSESSLYPSKIFTFDKKKFSNELRPAPNCDIEAEICNLPASFALTTPAALRAIQSVIACLPSSNDPLLLWALLAITESDPHVVLHLKELNAVMKDEGSKTLPPGIAEQRIEWLSKLALEGSGMLETRIGGRWILGSETTLEKKAEALFFVLSLRFLTGVGVAGGREEEPQMLAQTEAQWLSAFIRIIGDIILQYTVENGYPMELLESVDSNIEWKGVLQISFQELRSIREVAQIVHTTNQVERSIPSLYQEMRRFNEVVLTLAARQSEGFETLTSLKSQQILLEKQLLNFVEGAGARHTNQIKILMDRYDNMGGEIRKLSGLTATQIAALGNQCAEVKRNIERQSLPTDDAVSLLDGPTVAATSPRRIGGLDEILARLARVENQLITFSREEEKPAHATSFSAEIVIKDEVENFMSAKFLKLKNDLKEHQKNILNEALKSLSEITDSVQAILQQRQRKPSGATGENTSLVGEMLDTTECRVKKLMEFVDNRLFQIASSHTSAGIQQDIASLQSLTVAMEERMRKAEHTWRTAELGVHSRIAEFERVLYKIEDTLRVVEDDGSRMAAESLRAISVLRSETMELISATKKKIKQGYIGDIVLRIEDLERNRSPPQDDLQWDMGNITATVRDTAVEIENLRGELNRALIDKQDQSEAFRAKLLYLENAINALREEKKSRWDTTAGDTTVSSTVRKRTALWPSRFNRSELASPVNSSSPCADSPGQQQQQPLRTMTPPVKRLSRGSVPRYRKE